MTNNMNNNFTPCHICKHNFDPDNKNWLGECYDCVGDHNQWKPSTEFIQFLNKNNYQLTNNKTLKIILGFPGVGKTYCKEYYKGQNIKVLDSDSSEFPKDDFPNNYIEHIKNVIAANNVNLMFVSSHKQVRDAIYKDQYIMEYASVYICYPDKKLKEDFMGRYRNRGNNDKFIKLISDNWDNWIDEIEKENYFYPLKLTYKGEYLKNILYKIHI